MSARSPQGPRPSPSGSAPESPASPAGPSGAGSRVAHAGRAAAAIPRRRFGYVLAPVASTTMMIGGSAPSPFYPTLADRLGLDGFGIALVFAVYVVALLVSLLTAGSLSDYVGRRPLISGGLVILAGSVLIFWSADSTEMLLLARVVQGIATGILMSTLSATITDFAPPTRPQSAAVVNGVTPMVGLALGAVLAGVVLDLAPDAALDLVFLPLVVLYLVFAVTFWFVPETSSRQPGWGRALLPRMAVPAPARRMFVMSVPVVLAGWSTGGLFLSLGPNIVRDELYVGGHSGQGIVIGLLPAVGAVAAFLIRNRSPRTITIFGSTALAAGTALMLLALVLHSFPLYVVAVVVAGSGFGTGFMGVVGSLLPLVPLHRRAELFAALYTVSYLAFGVPAVVAGALSTLVGLHATAIGYGIVVLVAASGAAILRARSRETVGAPVPPVAATP